MLRRINTFSSKTNQYSLNPLAPKRTELLADVPEIKHIVISESLSGSQLLATCPSFSQVQSVLFLLKYIPCIQHKETALFSKMGICKIGAKGQDSRAAVFSKDKA